MAERRCLAEEVLLENERREIWVSMRAGWIKTHSNYRLPEPCIPNWLVQSPWEGMTHGTGTGCWVKGSDARA